MSKPITYLFTGRPCSGKTTIVELILNYLEISMKDKLVNFDGDTFRKIHTPHLGFTFEDRRENLRIFAEKAKEANKNGKIVLASFVSPTNEIRNLIKEIIGPENFRLIYIQCPLKVCEERDVKGHYSQAHAGKRPFFTGVDPKAPFEEPENPDLILKTNPCPAEKCVDEFLKYFGFKD